MPQAITPTIESILQTLPKQRIASLGREFGVVVSENLTKQAQSELIVREGTLSTSDLGSWLGRDELKSACRSHGIDDSGRSRSELAARLFASSGSDTSKPGGPPERRSDQPHVGDIAHVRHRQYLVEAVLPIPGQMTRVDLVCLDDDNPGRSLSVLWDLELGAKVVTPQSYGLGQVTKLDPPRHFAAYLHALKWNSVTATDAKLFQSPFRAGVRLMNHQLTPLKKALELPRANLFIADDVGLGKTIEAGLILQELLLRQRVEFALIICPASVALQWRGEMQKRFGLSFEIYHRRFLARRRQERGFQVNPWSTHNRFIITYQTLRRPEYRDPLLQHIGERARKSLLILDEAHTAAPAAASKYAVDSRVTQVIRDVAPRFENRLFLSATPHNGHSNSFSSLLEILDPQRFTRGVPIRSPTQLKQLETVMIRRLKTDLRALGVEEFPSRKVVQYDLRSTDGQWFLEQESQKPIGLQKTEPVELRLGEMLNEYAALMAPQKRAAKIVFENLQKRLLSSIEAFAKTLTRHAESMKNKRPVSPAIDPSEEDDDEYGLDDDAIEGQLSLEVEAGSQSIPNPSRDAGELLKDMLALANKHRSQPEAKAAALVEWIRNNQCPDVRLGGAAEGARGKWKDTRVIIFTEYGDTKRYLAQTLANAIEGTQSAEERILELHGGMSDQQREEVQRAFNGPPGEYPVRILIATDAAREGVNLQAHCSNLFHYDIPWNPSRMEQRNGRIDRTLQPAAEVNCHYFFYPQRPEDNVLKTLVRKVETIQEELGSQGSVVMENLARAFEGGIHQKTQSLIDAAGDGSATEVQANELESQRNQQQLKRDIDDAGAILNKSRLVMEFAPELLRDAINVGLEFAGAAPLQEAASFEGLQTFTLPPMPAGWDETIDVLRPARKRDEDFWAWRKHQPVPVVFEAPRTMNSEVAQLHLQHPLVRRILSRFSAQGYSTHDLSRVTVVRTSQDAVARVIAFGRLSLFGPRGIRLHDELISVAAPWLESGGPKHLKPFADEADRKAIDHLEDVLKKAGRLTVSDKVQERLLKTAAADFQALWKSIEDESEARGHAAKRKLKERADVESEALRTILESQRAAISALVDGQTSFDFGDSQSDRDQKRQVEEDRKHWKKRLGAIDKEVAEEPQAIAALYNVALERLETVGLIYLWPETRG